MTTMQPPAELVPAGPRPDRPDEEASEPSRQPVPVAVTRTPAAPQPSLPVALARRVMPVVAASAGVALATLAAERALASVALRAIDRAGLTPSVRRADPGVVAERVIVTRTVIVERVLRGP